MLFVVFMIILLLIFIAIVILTIHQTWKYRKLNKIPGPTQYPLFGNILDVGLTPVELLKDFIRICRKYGNTVTVKLGPINTYVLTSDPELIEFFISSQKFLTKSRDYNLFRPWIGNGLLTSTDSYWRKRRKIITPTFHFKILESYIPIFNSRANVLIKKLSENVDKGLCNVFPHITAYALDTICETAMGVSVNAQENSDNEYVAAVRAVIDILIIRTFSIWKQFDIFFQFSNDFHLQKKYIDVMHGFTRSVITQRHQELLEKNNKSTSASEEDDFGTKKKQGFLDLLLQSTIDGEPLTDDDISEEVNTFMFEGHDTTASAISFAMYELSRNQEIQQKAFDEVNEIFQGDKNVEPTITQLNNLNYLELIIKETLRLYPSVPIFARQIEEDVEHNGTVYPKGLVVVFFAYYMHRRADLFPNPEKFDPERFTIENCNGRHPFAYIPFSAGPRNCIGQKFAMYEIKNVLSKILFNFKLMKAEPKYDVILSPEVILKSSNGVHIQLKKR